MNQSLEMAIRRYNQDRLNELRKIQLNQSQTRTSVQIDEFIQGWINFARKCRIRSGTKMIPFNPYDHQIELVRQSELRNLICAKTRQLGFTETAANKFLYKATLNPAYRAVVFSKGGDDTAKIAQRVQVMASSAGLKLEIANTREIKIASGGGILFRTSTPDSGRGLESVSDFLFDEWAFVRLAYQIYGSATPAAEMVGSDARTLIISTPNGKPGGQQYWDILSQYNGDRDVEAICEQIRQRRVDPVQYWVDENGWCKFICHWLAHPVYRDRPNYLSEIKRRLKLNETTLQREFNLSFTNVESGNVFNLDWFDRYRYLPTSIRRVIQSWDTAQEKSETSANWACVTIVEDTNGRYYVVDVFSRKLDYVTGRRALIANYLKISEMLQPPTVVLIEKKSTGSVILQENANGDLGLRLPAKAFIPTGSKLERALVEAPACESKKVLLPETATWLPAFLNALSLFPAQQQDEIDAFSQALCWLRLNPVDPFQDKGLVGNQRSIRTLIEDL